MKYNLTLLLPVIFSSFTIALPFDGELLYEVSVSHFAQQEFPKEIPVQVPQISPSKVDVPPEMTPQKEYSNKTINENFDTKEVNIENIQKRLLSFYDNLRSYVSEESFNVEKFTMDQPILEQQFLKVNSSMKSFNNYKHITVQFLFITRIFKTMRFTAQRLKLLSGLNFPGSRILYKTIECNVRALVLFNTYGITDFNKFNIAERVEKLEKSLHYWKERFIHIKRTSLGKKNFFENRYNRAQATLRDLKSVMHGSTRRGRMKKF